MILRRLRSAGHRLRFLVANLKAFGGLPRFGARRLSDAFVMRGCLRGEVGRAAALRMELDGHRVTWSVRVLLTLFPDKCCLVLCDRRGGLKGLSMFYFNDRDFVEGTIHEGFIGVRPEVAGNGLASGMRRFVKEHFAQVEGINGISSRITLSNSASVASGVKAGYECVEVYEDGVAGEQRGYFVNRLDREVNR